MNPLIELEADARSELHRTHATRRPLSDEYDLVGLIGEAEFARIYKQPLDLDQKPSGDGKVDFVVPLAFTVDVKTYRKPANLIQEVGKVVADIYVLARYSDLSKKAELLGWQWGSVLKSAPYKDFGYGIVNHYIPASDLQPMAKLAKRIMRLGSLG